ncbi:MAG: hypothetical protein V5A85_08630 [Haloarculaceae archaeon]
MSRVAPLALVALVLLAGCGSVAPAGDGTPTRTVTAAPLPGETPTPRGPPVLAPGLSTEGVFDAARLADAHAATLSATSFTAVREERRRYANGSLRSGYRSVVRMAAGGERFRYALNQTDVRGGSPREQGLARYSNGSVVYVAITRDGATTYSVLGGEDPVEPSTVFPGNATARFGVARLFGSLRFDVLGRETVDGRTVYRVGVENGSQTLSGLRNVTMNATVREDGLVTRYRLTYEVGGLRVFVTVEFRRVGETAVEPPAWLPAARNATGVGTGAGGGPGTATPTTTRAEGRSDAPTAGHPPGGPSAVAVSPRPPRGPGASGAVSSRSWSGGAGP